MKDSRAPRTIEDAALLNLLRRLSVKTREPDEPAWVLSSGRESRFYVDCRQTLLHPSGMKFAGELMYRTWEQSGVLVDGVGGPSVGADPLTCSFVLHALARGCYLPGVFIRKAPKGHGTGNKVEGVPNLLAAVPDGAVPHIVLLEDVITTGGSSIRSIRAIRKAGLETKLLIVLVDREEGGKEAIEAEEGVKVISLFTKSDFVGETG